MIAAYEMQSKTQNECSVAACMGEATTVDVVEGDATAPSTSNNDPSANSPPSSTSSSSPTSSSNRVVWSCSCILVLVAALIGATM